MSQPLTVAVLLKLIDRMSDPMKVAVAGSSKSLDSLGQKADSTGKQIAASANFGATAVKGLVGAFSAYKVMDLVRDSALLSARFETMGVVMGVAGNNAGYTRAEMASLEKQMQTTGISMVKSREVLTSLATANIDLAKATGLARAAQDLAVVGNLNSSDALARMVQGIKSGEVEILKTLGLNVSFEASYKKLAASLGINTTALTEQQKVQARTDAVMAGSAAYAGIYEESLTTAGKALNSLTRYWEDFKLRAGDAFLPALAGGVFELTDALKAANAELDKAGSASTIDSIGNGLAAAFRTVYETVVVLGANVAYVFAGIGREIGGIAAQAAAVARLDFAGAKFIGAEMKKDADAARLAVDAFSETILNHTQKTAAAAKTSEAARIAAGEAARKAATDEAAAAAVVAAATEAKARAAKAAAAAYSQAVKASQDYIAQIQKETATLGMSDAQQALHTAEQIAGTMKLAGVREKALVAFLNQSAREIAAREQAAAKWAAFDREFEAAINGQAAMVEKFDADAQNENSALERMKEQYLNMAEPLRQYYQQLNELALLKEKFPQLADVWLEAELNVHEQIDAALGKTGEKGKDAFADLKQAVEGWGKDASNTFADWAMGAETSIADVGKAWVREFLSMMAYKQMFEPMANAASGAMGSVMNTIFSAQGNAFPGDTGLSAYRNTVVDRPTMFAFARGAGIMGEKPGSPGEAIMPLQRMSGGDLGVKVAGGGGGSMIVNIIESPGNGGKTEQRQDNSGANILDVYVEQIKGSIAGDISSGRGAIPGALAGTYGLNRVAGAY